MKTQEEIAKDSSTKTLEGNSNHSPCNIYAGKVEVLHQSYKSNGLLKVRIPIVHDGWPIDRVPWSKLSTMMRCYCAEWDDPSSMYWSGEVAIDVEGETTLELTGEVNIQGSIAGTLTGNISISDPGTSVSGPATGSVEIEGDIGGEAGVEMEGTQEQEMAGWIGMTITPTPHSVFPWKKVRAGAGLIRVGDLVLVAVVNNDENNLVVMDLLI